MKRAQSLDTSLIVLAVMGCTSGEHLAADELEVECEFVLSVNEVSADVPTVGIVEWSLVDLKPRSARIVFELDDAGNSVLNRGGVAPVDLSKPNYRTLLLGLKSARSYHFHIQAVVEQGTCESPHYALPLTGNYEVLPDISVEVTQAGKREPGFIVTSSGTSRPSSAFIIDADGEIVWYYEAPGSTTRALMDYEGEHMWMLALNLLNSGGEMRYVSMDGVTRQSDVPGLDTAHHDFTVMPGGRIAALAWKEPGIDPESELLIRSPDGSVARRFTIGNNLFISESFHANAIHYLAHDDSFTISDLNPNVLVSVSSLGEPQWQLGGTCEGAPAGSRCKTSTWELNHGHQLLEDGTFVFFNNTNDDTSHVLEFRVDASSTTFVADLQHDYAGSAFSSNLGDVQRLPGGNTLVTYSAVGRIEELDSSWNLVQVFSVRVGYTSFRPSLYGPPTRL
jgi:hypothetical protein